MLIIWSTQRPNFNSTCSIWKSDLNLSGSEIVKIFKLLFPMMKVNIEIWCVRWINDFVRCLKIGYYFDNSNKYTLNQMSYCVTPSHVQYLGKPLFCPCNTCTIKGSYLIYTTFTRFTFYIMYTLKMIHSLPPVI